MKKYIFAFSLITLSVMMMFFVQVKYKGGDKLRIGSKIPSLKYFNRNGFQILAADSIKPLVILYFHSGCEHCIYQLDQIEKNLDQFSSQKFIFLTYEKKFFAESKDSQWGLLSTQDEYSFGIVNENEFRNYFGTVYTPSIFIFNPRGSLCSKFDGEVKIEKLLAGLAGCKI